MNIGIGLLISDLGSMNKNINGSYNYYILEYEYNTNRDENPNHAVFPDKWKSLQMLKPMFPSFP